MEGWVWKRSRFWKRWRRRWLVLLPEELRSFRSRQAAQAATKAGSAANGASGATEVVLKGSVIRVYLGWMVELFAWLDDDGWMDV